MAGHAWRADHVGLDWKGFRFAPSEVVPIVRLGQQRAPGMGRQVLTRLLLLLC